MIFFCHSHRRSVAILEISYGTIHIIIVTSIPSLTSQQCPKSKKKSLFIFFPKINFSMPPPSSRRKRFEKLFCIALIIILRTYLFLTFLTISIVGKTRMNKNFKYQILNRYLKFQKSTINIDAIIQLCIRSYFKISFSKPHVMPCTHSSICRKKAQVSSRPKCKEKLSIYWRTRSSANNMCAFV